MSRKEKIKKANGNKIITYMEIAIGIDGDVRKREDAVRVLESTIKHFGRLDILVNAAAGNFLVPAEDLSPNGFQTGLIFRIMNLSIVIILVDFSCFF